MKNSPEHIRVSNDIACTPLFKGCVGQDGAIFGDWLFRFESNGTCTVYSLKTQAPVGCFTLDKADVIKPHSNSVTFGTERISPDDEFPLLYTNIYNNYSAAADRLEGVCCVYRITRTGSDFDTRLIQVIRIGFVDDTDMWKSLPGAGDVRPYGNFAADPFAGELYAFTMRDAANATRYFRFRLPTAAEGEYSAEYGANVVTLSKDDIIDMFDSEYSNYLQGACAYGGMLISVEGFTTDDPAHPRRPRMQIIDMYARKQLACVELTRFGLLTEPELVDFSGDELIYMDASGAAYRIDFR